MTALITNAAEIQVAAEEIIYERVLSHLPTVTAAQQIKLRE